MNIQKHTTPDMLEKYSFLWSEVRLCIAAVALFLGGIPPVYYIFGYFSPLYGLMSSLLSLSWLVSGVASAYLGYRWYTEGQTLFGGKDTKDTVAFVIMVISGINLGLAGIVGNIGMSITTSQPVFVIVGILYIISAIHLYRRWNEYGQKMFGPNTIIEAEKTIYKPSDF